MSNHRYEVLGKIGQGGLGEVYLARDTQLDRDVALKRVRMPEDGNAAALSEDLIREAVTLSKLQHPNIVTVFDVGKDEKGPYVVLELLKGETLDSVIDRGALPLADFQEVVIQTLEGLIGAQALGLVHRDLKPGNIMVCWLASGKFQIKILDFGLAKFTQKARPQTEDQGGGIFGSIYFMAPEQFERLPLDARTDMYSVGCIFYQILTTKHPFEGETGTEVMVSHLQHHVRPLQHIRRDLPEWLANWVMWLISREMDDRPADARVALQHFVAQQHALKNPPPPAVAAPVLGAVNASAVANPTKRILNPAAMRQAPGQRPGGPGYGPAPAMGAMPRGPAKKSNVGIWIVLGAVGLGLIGGIAYILLNRSDKKPATAPPKSAEAAGALLEKISTRNALPPVVEMPQASNPSVAAFQSKDPVVQAMVAAAFNPQKSSERLKIFSTVLETQAAGKYDAAKHGPVLRLIPHESAIKFAQKFGDAATARELNEVHEKRFKGRKLDIVLDAVNADLILAPSVKHDAALDALVGWTHESERIAFDTELTTGTWNVKLVQSCQDVGDNMLRMSLSSTTSPATLALKSGTEFLDLDMGEFVLPVGGTFRIWLWAEKVPHGKPLPKIRAIKLQRR